jgi:hypothetical protein
MARDLANVVDAARHFVAAKPALEAAHTVLRRRVIFMGLPSLSFDCLRDALNVSGIDAESYTFEQSIPARALGYDVFLLFLARYEASSQPVIRRRMDELRERMSKVPAVALIEDAGTDAAALRQMGFSTVVAGLPSMRFAVDLVRLFMISIRPTIDSGEIAADKWTSSGGHSDPVPRRGGRSMKERERRRWSAPNRGRRRDQFAPPTLHHVRS